MHEILQRQAQQLEGLWTQAASESQEALTAKERELDGVRTELQQVRAELTKAMKTLTEAKEHTAKVQSASMQWKAKAEE